MFTIDDLWRIMKYLKDGTTDPNLSELTTSLATSEKITVESFFENILDQGTFNSNDYNKLRQMLIDWYSSHKTIATTQRDASDVHKLPNQDLSELFKSFGFPIGLELVPLSTKANFFLDLVNFYKKKGSPETLVDVLDYYGFSDTDLIEYWLQKDQFGNLVFRGESVRLAATGSTVLLDTDVPFEALTTPDPHWFQTKSDIEALITTNKINLPSKTPYFSLSSIFSLYSVNISLSILFRIVQDQYDRYTSSLELPYNIPVKNLGLVLPLLHIYVGTIYCFEKMFGYGTTNSFTNYNCYDGTVKYLGDPPVPFNLSSLTSIAEDLIKRPQTKEERETRLEELFNSWSRPLSEHFLNSLNAAEPLIASLNQNFKDVIDSWFALGDESFLITYLLGTLDNWIRLNVDSKSPSLVITMLGLGFRKELAKIINFFKPYRARLAYMDTAYSIKNPLTESVMLGDWVLTGIHQNIHNHIRPPDDHCPIGTQIPEIDPEEWIRQVLESSWKWDFGKFFDDMPPPPTPTEDPSLYPPILCDVNEEWLYDIGRRYDPEYLNFKYDSGGYYDIIPYLQKCLMELIKNHPDGGMCDSIEYEIGQFFHDKVGATSYFDINFDLGANFDSGYEEQWRDRLELIDGEVDEDVIIMTDDSTSEIEQTINDNFGLGPPTQMDVGQTYDELIPKPVVTDSFVVVIVERLSLMGTSSSSSAFKGKDTNFQDRSTIIWHESYVERYLDGPELKVQVLTASANATINIFNTTLDTYKNISLTGTSYISTNTDSELSKNI